MLGEDYRSQGLSLINKVYALNQTVKNYEEANATQIKIIQD